MGHQRSREKMGGDAASAPPPPPAQKLKKGHLVNAGTTELLSTTGGTSAQWRSTPSVVRQHGETATPNGAAPRQRPNSSATT